MAGVRGAGTFKRPELSQCIDDVIAALELSNPPWLALYDDETLPLHVASMLHTGAAIARETADGEEEGIYESGGVRILYDPVAESTAVYVLVGNVYDPGTEGRRMTDAAGRRCIPAALRVDVELADARDVVEALCSAGEAWATGNIRSEPDGRVEIESNLGAVRAATALYRTALAIEDARLAAEGRPGKGRRHG